MNLIPATALRVRQNTKNKINSALDAKTQSNLKRYQNSSREVIEKRLEELNREWDTERFLEANASALILVGVALSFWISNWWLILAGLISFYLLQHAIQGWCPPLPLIRKAGIRTPREIEEERAHLFELLKDKPAETR